MRFSHKTCDNWGRQIAKFRIVVSHSIVFPVPPAPPALMTSVKKIIKKTENVEILEASNETISDCVGVR